MARNVGVRVVVLVGIAVAGYGAPDMRLLEKRFMVGACTHFGQHKGVLDLNLNRMKQAGIASLRDEISWARVERKKGQLSIPRHGDTYVRAAARAGIKPMIILDYANRHYDGGDRPRSPGAIDGYCRYAEVMVRHFGSDVAFYEIWNEYDIGIGLPPPYRKGGSPEDYVTMLKAVYPRIKAINPDVTVMAGACTSGGVNRGWFEGILKLGALSWCDAVSVHSYNYSPNNRSRTPEAWLAWMENVRAMLRRHNTGTDVPLYVTEMGWPTHVGKRGTSPELSGSYLGRLYLLGRTMPSFKGLWWYDFQDDGWNPEHNENNFGMVRPDLTPKPSFYVMKDIANLVADGTYAGRVTMDAKDLWILRFNHGDEDVWALWSADNKAWQVVVEKATAAGAVTVAETGRTPLRTPWGYRPWARRRGGALAGNQLSLVIGARPVLVRGDMSGVTLKSATLVDDEKAESVF